MQRRARRGARQMVATALQAPDAVVPLVRLLAEGGEVERLEAALGLGAIAGCCDADDRAEMFAAGAAEALVHLLAEDQPPVGRRLAAEILGHLAAGSEEEASKVLAAGAAEPLAQLLAEGAPPYCREPAAAALRYLAGERPTGS